MDLTQDTLAACMPQIDPAILQVSVDTLGPVCARVDITTPKRLAACLATCYWESGFTKEFVEADGSYLEGRADLGNVHPGDGQRYRGRGWIHTTGLDNYFLCGQALGLDLIMFPELLEQPGPAADSMGWFWTANDLNARADQSFDLVTERVNGRCTDGPPSYQAETWTDPRTGRVIRGRRYYYTRNCRLLGCTP